MKSDKLYNFPVRGNRPFNSRLSLNFLNNLINRFYNTFFSKDDYIRQIDKISRELCEYNPQINDKNEICILYGPSFSIHPPCLIHDRLFSLALQLRGVKIIPFYCDGIQSVECDFYGGLWMNGVFEEKCKSCQSKSEKVWEFNPSSPLKLSHYLSQTDYTSISSICDNLHGEEWASYLYDNMPFGNWARDILVNNYLVGDFHRINNYNGLGTVHLKNLLLLHRAYTKMINTINPERVISHDSYYGMMAILQKLCEIKKIPFYSHWPGNKIGTWCYAYNDAAMNLNFQKPWEKFSKIPINETQQKKIRKWLNGRISGDEMVLDTASIGKNQTILFNELQISREKPTALLASNVIWDLAALNKEIIFTGMMDWIIQTIKWFEIHPNFQLIIKAHPGEQNQLIPETRERVETTLIENKVTLPQNVILVSPQTSMTIYQLFPFTNVGLVYTTTSGIEMAANNIPVVTTGKSPYRGFGFTLDPSSQKEYFEMIEKSLNGEKFIDSTIQVDLAYKFILFYQYHYFINTNLIEYKFGGKPRIKIHTIYELLPGKNKYLDYVIDSILKGDPIISENRWPPESN